VLSEKGELLLAPAAATGFKPTSRGQILGAVTRAFPALANGSLYARDGKSLVAVDLSPP
jgi:outer membrane protein assembly factor BamB